MVKKSGIKDRYPGWLYIDRYTFGNWYKSVEQAGAKNGDIPAKQCHTILRSPEPKVDEVNGRKPKSEKPL
jgi:hypothetical protein